MAGRHGATGRLAAYLRLQIETQLGRIASLAMAPEWQHR
jgi:hypothetical protein